MRYLSKLSFILLSFILTACTASLESRVSSSDATTKAAGFTKELVQGDQFLLTTYQKITDKNAHFVFYIEGDGHAFQNGNISDNPTPIHQMMLKLATLDNRPNVIYIARPCQYTPLDLSPKCNKTYWTDRRMSEEVVASINEVIEKINNGKSFNLVGYSGGGGIAVLIATRNSHVRDILTIAANLDHIRFNNHHNVRPMTGSLNPIDYAAQITNIPQLHISGKEDNKVPPFIAKEYVKKSSSACVNQRVLSGVKHNEGWEKHWKQILSIPIVCSEISK